MRMKAIREETELVERAKKAAKCEHLKGVFRLDHVARLGTHYRLLQKALVREIEALDSGRIELVVWQKLEGLGDEAMFPHADILPFDELMTLARNSENVQHMNVEAAFTPRVMALLKRDEFKPPRRPPPSHSL